MTDCVFCKIVRREIPAKVVAEDDQVIVFANIQPAAQYHYLIAPKKHIAEFVKVDSKTMSSLTQMAKQVIKAEKLAKAYKLVFNGGKYIGIDHLHWHLLGGEMDKDYQEKI